MKIRELKRRVGSAVISAWPPQWGGATDRSGLTAVGEVGVLKAVHRDRDRLDLVITDRRKQFDGPLEWDHPPSVDDVEHVLRANVGREIPELSNLDV